MSERLTGIELPGAEHSSGLAEYGRKTPEEMIAAFRKYAEHLKAEAEEILAASDGDFRVTTYLGPWVMRNKEVLQEGRDQ